MTKKRILFLDVLRGIAICAVLLLHHLEHFDVYHFPKTYPSWLVTLDKGVWQSLFFIFAGKAYSIFAMLFGVTFYIQMNGAKERGTKCWDLVFFRRMIILFLVGMINSIFFQGDILSIYSVLGILLIPLSHIRNTKILWSIAFILMLHPLAVYQLTDGLLHPTQTLENPASWHYFGEMNKYITEGSFIATAKGNLVNGRTAVLLWSYENGRYFTITALFITGWLLAKKDRFSHNEKNHIFWRNCGFTALGLSVIIHTLFYLAKAHIKVIPISRPLMEILSCWKNISFMFVLVALFYWGYNQVKLKNIMNFFAPLGAMSMSNYVFQSLTGGLIYYGYGLGLYKYTGATFSSLIGVVIIITAQYLSRWWQSSHKRGPLETVWHKLTWLGKR
ncbi:DUF418 domain-containing protein [Halosquirtibacter laminarini]|uniref:DUF418 domain-containing protein n=1 Tax=Halosquirtibacter laminarini TaxID=3374600 RepID=A0AC61NMB0_9BACT|nr:DUF418 domain-containing protein [Prolixibacteraceae bacterium]